MNDERWQHLFRDYGNSSFSELLRRDSPHLFPSPAAARPPVEHPAPPEAVPHGTTERNASQGGIPLIQLPR